MVSYKLRMSRLKSSTHGTIEVTQFYLQLSSNSSLYKFPNKTLTEYRVGLPQTVSLETGKWLLQKFFIRTAGIMSSEILAIDSTFGTKNCPGYGRH